MDLVELGAKLSDLLRLRTLPIGLKLFEDVEEARAIPNLRVPTPEKRFTTCQLITQARWSGQTVGILADNVMPFSNCGAIVGLSPLSDDHYSGARMTGVWFENQEAAHQHQVQMVRVEGGKYNALVASPLRSGRLNPPDIVCFYANPAQMILFFNGLQWKNYRRYDFSITGESACSDSWGKALATREVSLSLPCYAERRYGGVQDDELLMCLPPEEFERAITGLEGLYKAGLRYPIMPYGTTADPTAGLSRSYKEPAKAPSTAEQGS